MSGLVSEVSYEFASDLCEKQEVQETHDLGATVINILKTGGIVVLDAVSGRAALVN